MRDAIAKQSHPILYSLCEWGQADVTTWGNATGSSWRTTGDITRKFPTRSSTMLEKFRPEMSSYCTEWLTIQFSAQQSGLALPKS
jgi:hypothetical protein